MTSMYFVAYANICNSKQAAQSVEGANARSEMTRTYFVVAHLRIALQAGCGEGSKCRSSSREDRQ